MIYYNLGNGVAEIGIKIYNSDYQEKGLGRVILSMLIRELFDIGYLKIVLDTDFNNKRAQHVYEKLGFRQVDIKLNSWKDQLGNLCSSINYELIENNFVEYK